jgi:hypothetical protein
MPEEESIHPAVYPNRLRLVGWNRHAPSRGNAIRSASPGERGGSFARKRSSALTFLALHLRQWAGGPATAAQHAAIFST